jgi:hypothetical protein
MSEEKPIGRFEMLWDCGFCSASRLLAVTHRHCPECGAAQDQAKRYFPKDDEKVAVKDDYAGADRTCPSCNAPNGAKASCCAQCGAPLDEAAAVRQRSVRVAAKGMSFAEDSAKAGEAELGSRGAAKPAAGPPSKRKLYYTLAIVAAVIFALWFLCIRKRSAAFEVTAQRWTRTIVIEEYKEVEKEAWKHELPAGARELGCSDKVFETKKVQNGEDCSTRKQVDKGDGTFEEKAVCVPTYDKIPVKRPMCRYAILEWTELEKKVASGEGAGERSWPPTGVTPQPQQPGARREGARTEEFVVELVEGGKKKHTCEVAEQEWAKLTKGAKAVGEVRARSGDIVCSTVRAK